jgi:small subunit ribosomal protein S17
MELKRKIRVGRVVSNKMDKTVVVEVETTKHHPIYKKTIKRANRYKAHDAGNECGEGDMVRIIETRPLSKEKRWRVSEIITRKEALDIKPEEIGTETLGDETE